MPSNLKIAELLCTKFCHDIVGPVGAISNGVDFLMEEIADLKSQSAELISNSSHEAIARLMFMRQSFGQNSTDSSVSLTEARDLAVKFFSHGKITLNWPDQYTDLSEVQVSSMHRKIILNLLLIASSSLMKGGKINFSIRPNVTEINVQGDVVKVDAVTESILRNNFDPEKLDARNIQTFYTTSLINEAKMKLALDIQPTSLTLTLQA